MTDELAEFRERRLRAVERRREIDGDYFEATHNVIVHNVPWEGKAFAIASTQERLVDFATPESGTYPLTLECVDLLVAALTAVAEEIRRRDRRPDGGVG